MKHKFIALLLLSSLLLCGCNGGDNSESKKESIDQTATSTEIADSSTKETATEAAAKPTETPAATKNKATGKENTETSRGSEQAQEAVIDFGDESSVVTTTAVQTKPVSTEKGSQKQIQTEAGTEAPSKSTETSTEERNELKDDGLNWSPLVPVE